MTDMRQWRGRKLNIFRSIGEGGWRSFASVRFGHIFTIIGKDKVNDVVVFNLTTMSCGSLSATKEAVLDYSKKIM